MDTSRAEMGLGDLAGFGDNPGLGDRGARTHAGLHGAGLGGRAGKGLASADPVVDDRVAATDDAAPLPHPHRSQLDLAAVLHALSDPMRLRIVAELSESGGARPCSSFDLPIVKSTCTHHFKVLREAGLIRQQVMGTKRVNWLRSDDLEARFPGLLEAVLRGATPVV